MYKYVNIEQMLSERNMLDERKTTNLEGKSWQKQNAQRFINYFKFTRELSHPDQFYQKIDSISFYRMFFNIKAGFNLNTISSLPSIQMLGDKEQGEFWRKEILKGNILVGYGQT